MRRRVQRYRKLEASTTGMPAASDTAGGNSDAENNSVALEARVKQLEAEKQLAMDKLSSVVARYRVLQKTVSETEATRVPLSDHDANSSGDDAAAAAAGGKRSREHRDDAVRLLGKQLEQKQVQTNTAVEKMKQLLERYRTLQAQARVVREERDALHQQLRDAEQAEAGDAAPKAVDVEAQALALADAKDACEQLPQEREQLRNDLQKCASELAVLQQQRDTDTARQELLAAELDETRAQLRADSRRPWCTTRSGLTNDE